MTIALGLKALDGTVLAADTEYSGGEYYKTTGPKVFTSYGETRRQGKRPVLHSIGVTGMGSVPHIAAIKDELLGAHTNATLAGLVVQDDQTNCFSEVLRTFYSANVLPFSPQPDLALIISTSLGSFEDVWVTEGTTIRLVEKFAAIGVGYFAANELLSKLWWPSDVITMTMLAIHVIHEVKRTVPGCGQLTQVCYLADGKIKTLNPNYVETIETTFRKYWSTQRIAFYNTLGSLNPSPTWEDVAMSYSQIRGELSKFIGEIKTAPFDGEMPDRGRNKAAGDKDL